MDICIPNILDFIKNHGKLLKIDPQFPITFNQPPLGNHHFYLSLK